MGDIFVSYQRDDRALAQKYVSTFAGMGWSVWWDNDIAPSTVWSATIEESIRNSRCVVVLWSKSSVNSVWVQREARYALEHKSPLVPVRIDDTAPPLEFDHIQSARGVNWEQHPEDFARSALAVEIARILHSVKLETDSIELDSDEKCRMLEGTASLRDALFGMIPVGTKEGKTLIAIWDIKKFGFTPQRIGESQYYIATIINQFDLILIPEVKRSLADADLLLEVLGPNWDYQVSDVRDVDSPNVVRSLYLFNNDRVRLSGAAHEINLNSEKKPTKRITFNSFVTSFRIVGGERISFLTYHPPLGTEAESVALRRQYAMSILSVLDVNKDQRWTKNLVLVGDFNFESGIDDGAAILLEDAGFVSVTQCGIDTALPELRRERFYARLSQNFRPIEDTINGVFNPFDSIFREEDTQAYSSYLLDVYTGSKNMADPENQIKYFKFPWRINQISDHFPTWFAIEHYVP